VTIFDKPKSSVDTILAKFKIASAEKKKGLCPEKNELESPFTGTQSDTPTNEMSLSVSESKPGMWISGKGSILCIHFSGESEKSLLALFWHHMLENGIYLAQRGFMALNLELKKEHVDKFLLAVDEFVSKNRQALTRMA